MLPEENKGVSKLAVLLLQGRTVEAPALHNITVLMKGPTDLYRIFRGALLDHRMEFQCSAHGSASSSSMFFNGLNDILNRLFLG